MAGDGPVAYIHLNGQKEALSELTEVLEDTVEYYCDQQTVSGELAWTVVESLATAKLAQLKGEVSRWHAA